VQCEVLELLGVREDVLKVHPHEPKRRRTSSASKIEALSMLSFFPQLLDWSWYVPLVFRIFLAVYLFAIGYSFAKAPKDEKGGDGAAWMVFGILLIALSVLLFVGIYAQIAGTIVFVISLIAMYFKYRKAQFTPESEKFYLLVGLVALSLVFLGTGPYAFDIPL